MEQIRRQHPELILYNGYDEIFASGVIAGADGGIGSTYNIMGWRYKNILSAIEKVIYKQPDRFRQNAIRLLIL